MHKIRIIWKGFDTRIKPISGQLLLLTQKKQPSRYLQKKVGVYTIHLLFRSHSTANSYPFNPRPKMLPVALPDT